MPCNEISADGNGGGGPEQFWNCAEVRIVKSPDSPPLDSSNQASTNTVSEPQNEEGADSLVVGIVLGLLIAILAVVVALILLGNRKRRRSVPASPTEEVWRRAMEVDQTWKTSRKALEEHGQEIGIDEKSLQSGGEGNPDPSDGENKNEEEIVILEDAIFPTCSSHSP